MSPRVSEAARIFAVAAFLALVAQGPTFSGGSSQMAAANCAKNGAIVQCDEQKVDKKVEVEKGAPTVETKNGGDATKDPCSKESKAANYDAYKKAGCESKGEGKTTFKDEKGNEKEVCTTCGGGGPVGEGSGGNSNSSAVDQYASSDSKPVISQVPVVADAATSAAIDKAFPGVSDGTVKLAYPVTPADSKTSDAGGSSAPAPVSSVPGTTLDNSQPVNLNPDTIQNKAALTPPASNEAMRGVQSYNSPSNGSTLGTNAATQVVSSNDSLWKANQELGGVQSPVSPSQVFTQAARNELQAEVSTAAPRLNEALFAKSEDVIAQITTAQDKIDALTAGGISATQTGKLSELASLKAEVASGQKELEAVTRTYNYLNNVAPDPAVFARAYADTQRQPLLDSFVGRYDAAAQTLAQASSPTAGADSIFGTIAANTSADLARQEIAFSQGQIQQLTGEAPLSDNMRIALEGMPKDRSAAGQAYGWLTQQAALSPSEAADCAGTGSCVFRAVAAGAVKSAVDAVVRPLAVAFPSITPYEMAAQNVQMTRSQQAVQWALDSTITATNGAAIRALTSESGSLANVGARPAGVVGETASGLVIPESLPGTRALAFGESTVPAMRSSSYFGDIVPGSVGVRATEDAAGTALGSAVEVAPGTRGALIPTSDEFGLGSVRPGVQLAESTAKTGFVAADSSANTFATAAARDWPFMGIPGSREDSGQQQSASSAATSPTQSPAPSDTTDPNDQIASGSEGSASGRKSSAAGGAASTQEDGGASPAGMQRTASMVQLPSTPLFSDADKKDYAEAQTRVNATGKSEWIALDVGLVEVKPKVPAPQVAQNGIPVGGASSAGTNDSQSPVAGPYNGNQVASNQPATQATPPAPVIASPEAGVTKTPAPPSVVLGDGLGGGVVGSGEGKGVPAGGRPDAPPSESTPESEIKQSKTEVASNGASGNGSSPGKDNAGSSVGEGSAQGRGQDGQSQSGQQGKSSGSSAQGSGQGSATQSSGTSGGGSGVASANKTAPAPGQGSAPVQSAQPTKTAAAQKCDDVNANPGKYGAADIESCKSNLEKSLDKIAGVVGGVLNAVNPFASTLAQAEPAARAPSIADVMPAGIIRTARSGSRIPAYTPEQTQQLVGRTFSTIASNFSDAQGTKGPLNQNNIFFSSPDLPEGTALRVAVTNKAGVTTVLEGTVQDFGPDTGQVRLANRKIDLSQGACKASDSCTQGLASAQVTILPTNAGVTAAGRVASTGLAPGQAGAQNNPAPTTATANSQFVAALAPGQKPETKPTPTVQKDAGKQIGVCIGAQQCPASTGPTFTAKNYINPLCQVDLGCTAKGAQLGAKPDAKFPEWKFADPLSPEALKYYQQQVDRAIANASDGKLMIDNCNQVGYEVCAKIADMAAASNAARGDKKVEVWINNPQLVWRGADLLKHPAVGGAIVEDDKTNPKASSPGALDALRQMAGKPMLPVVFAGEMSFAKDSANAIARGRYGGMGTSASPISEGASGYQNVTGGVAVSGRAPATTPVGSYQRYTESQKPFVFGRAAADGKPELLDAKQAAIAQKNGEKLSVYEQSTAPNPFDVGSKNTFAKDAASGQWYQQKGSVDEYVAQKKIEAQAALENGARAGQVAQKTGKPVIVEGIGGTRRVYAQQADGSRGDQVGRIVTTTGDAAKLKAVAAQSGVVLSEKDGKLVDSEGRSVELRTVQNPGMKDGAFTALAKSGGTPQIPNSKFTTEYWKPLSTSPRSGVLGIIPHQSHGRFGSGRNTALSQSGGPVGAEWWILADGTRIHADTERSTGNVGQNNPPGAPQLLSLMGMGGGGILGNARAVGIEFEGMIGQPLSPAELESGKELIAFLQERYDRGAESILKHGKGGGAEGAEMEAAARAMNYVPGTGLPYLQIFAVDENGAVPLGTPVSSASVGGAKSVTTFESTDTSGAPDGKTQFALESVGDVGKADTSLAIDSEGKLGIQHEYTAPVPPAQPDTRNALERARDAAGQAAADANQRVRDMWKNMFGGGQPSAGGQQGGGAQPANNAVPANTARPAGTAAQPSSGTPAPTPARTQQPVTATPGQTTTGTNGAVSGQAAPVLSVSGGNTATGASGERFSCTPGTVVNGSTATPVTITWGCPSGTTSIGEGFSTLGTNTGTVKLVVSTTSASVNYLLTCQGAQTPQTLSCTVLVRHPRVTLVAKPATISAGTPVELQWSAFDVNACSLYAPPTVLLVTGGTSGRATTLPISRNTVFSALCNSGSSTTTASVTVSVNGDTSAPLQTILPR